LFKNLLVRGLKSGFSGLTLLAGYHKKRSYSSGAQSLT